jgi:hypothetical protein
MDRVRRTSCTRAVGTNWARAFLDDVDQRVLPVFGHRS